ncbi:MAG: hypothetical protein ACLGGX_08865 [Bdellovibrionia bacterium]
MINLLLFLSLGWSAVVNESVGRVGERVVTSREVKVSQAVEKILKNENKSISENSNQQEVTAVLLEWVVALEAENFSVGQVTPEEIESLLKDIEKKSSLQALLREQRFQEEELRKLLQRKLVARNFIQFKTNSFTSAISDEEAKTFYEANPKRFSGAGFEVLKPNIKSYLSQQQLNERLKSWFELLKRKYKVQNFLLDEK